MPKLIKFINKILKKDQSIKSDKDRTDTESNDSREGNRENALEGKGDQKSYAESDVNGEDRKENEDQDRKV